jgi:hypothetical protein
MLPPSGHAPAFGVFQDRSFAAFNYGHARIRGPKIEPMIFAIKILLVDERSDDQPNTPTHA